MADWKTDVKPVTPEFNDAASGKTPPKTPDRHLNHNPPELVPDGPGGMGGPGRSTVAAAKKIPEPQREEEAAASKSPPKINNDGPSPGDEGTPPISPKEEIQLRRAFRRAHDHDNGNSR